MCDSLCALAPATRAGTTLFGKNSDRPPGEAQRLEWHPPRRDTTPLRVSHTSIEPGPAPTLGVLGSRLSWMWGMEHGVNEAGVAIGNERIFTTLDPREAEPALTGMDLVRLGLERADSAAGAVEVVAGAIERHGQGGPCMEGGREPYWSSFLVADPTSGYVVETSGREVAVEAFHPVRSISNRPSIETFDRRHGMESPIIDACVDPRWSVTRGLLEAGILDAAAVRGALRSHRGGEDGWTVCMHVPDQQVTASSMVAALDVDRPVVWVAAGSPCRSVYVPLAAGPVGQPPAWERFAALGAGTEGRLAALEAGLDADFDPDDPDWPAEAWRRVEAELAAVEREEGGRDAAQAGRVGGS